MYKPTLSWKQKLRQKLFDLYKQNTQVGERVACCFCEKLYTLQEITIEHIVPRSKGGTNAISNLLLSCFKCNNDRGNIDFEKFKAYVLNGYDPIKVRRQHTKTRKRRVSTSKINQSESHMFPSDVQILLDQRRKNHEREQLTLFLQNLSKR